MLDSYLPSYQDAANLPPPPPIKRNRNRFTNRASGNNNNRYRQSGSVYSKPNGAFVQVPAYHSASFSSLHPIYLPLFRDQFQSRNSKPRRYNQKRRPQHQQQKQQRRRQNQPRQIQNMDSRSKP